MLFRSGNPISIDENGTLYNITNEGKLWRGNLDGSSSQLTLSDLVNNSLFAIDETGEEKQFIYTNNNRVFILNTNFETIDFFELKNNITKLGINNKGIMFSTENELYLRNSDGFTEGFPIESDGYYNIADIDNNGKINLINTKNGFIYNYEIKD